jgi:NTP pyrophosphatase (non-canonical NTP hydrolase)
LTNRSFDNIGPEVVYGVDVRFSELQTIIQTTYGERDTERGVPSTVAWLAEEVGELAQAVRKGTREQQEHEFADVLAWVATLANQMGIDLEVAVSRYRNGCPTCGHSPCAC